MTPQHCLTDTMYALCLFFVLFARAHSVSLDAMRGAKCVIPNGPDHIVRAALLQQCLSKNYAQGNETQCYPELGCFTMDSPWTSPLRPFPSPLWPAEIDVRLYGYSRESPERYNITLWPEISLEGFPFKADRNTVFITHGFSSDGNSSWLSDMKDAYLDEEDVNVFLVDWGRGAKLLNYLQVASNTRIAGAEVARYIKYLREKRGLKLGKVHLIGHSLGAHISSYAAKAHPSVVGRLTALDPAQPGFEGTSYKVRLDKTDADFVEVVHTNALPTIPTLGFGLIFPRGHVDFYMNGGLRQPGCQIPDITEIKSIEDFAKFPVEVINMWVSCSHGRSYEYFTAAMRSNCTIWGRKASPARQIVNAGTLGYIEPVFSMFSKCTAKSCLPIGLETPNFLARGSFAAATSSSPPFCENDPEVNQRTLLEIEDTDERSVDVLSDAVEGASDAAKGASDAAKGASDTGKSVVSGLTGSVRGLVSLGKNAGKKNSDNA